MGVPLQLILGVLLVAQCSTAGSPNIRQIREAPPPSPTPIHNVTEINNRDLNKIIKDYSKTEIVDSKAKLVNNVHIYEELPLKLVRSKDENHITASANISEDEVSSKEDFKNDTVKVVKEKHREDSSRAIDIDASKFWSQDFNSKNAFTLPPVPDIDKFPEQPDFSFDVTKHSSFESNSDLTTPTTKIFDQKFKETLESVEQNIEEDEHDHDTDNHDEQSKDVDVSVEDPLKKSENENLEFIKTKAIVNNETVDKNSIHKDLNFEQTKKLSYESIFNNTKVYGGRISKGEEATSTERTTTSTSPASTETTRKSYLLKELLTERTNTHILSNNIETETTKPVKGVVTSTTSSTIQKDKGDLEDTTITMTTAITNSEALTTELQSATISEETNTTASLSTTSSPTTLTTVSTPLLLNISDQENHVIPLHFGFKSTLIQESSSAHLPTFENAKRFTPEKSNKLNHSVETRIAIEGSAESSTTEIVIGTEMPETTTVLDATTLLSDGTIASDEGTTIFIVENTTEISDSTTEMPTTTIEVTTLIITTAESGHRTSKSLESSIVTEQTINVEEKPAENSTKIEDINAESTVRNEIDSITLSDGPKTETKPTEHIIEEGKDIEETTTESKEPTSTVSNTGITSLEGSQSVLVNVTTQKFIKLPETTTEPKVNISSTEEVSEVPSTTTDVKTTTQNEKFQTTTTEYAFVHIEHTDTNHTTLLPEDLGPNLNYSTTTAIDTKAGTIRKVTVDELGNNSADSSNSSSIVSSTTSTTTSTATLEPAIGDFSTTTEDTAETPTENSYSKDSGADKGKIAAIAISSVGAVCLVLLAGLLYVMKKRQKRLKYGPRCRPVSLDDYSIDNLSVYNSVRRKGGARISKRSFGNPAFEDPVAPTHPLNFPALAKFSTNHEDIKAEFEEIPQISARTSELPDGCETKNRYANVIPLPETRVFLKPIDGYPNSDYMNANYVTGPKNVKGYYIATQGPMQNTVDDFWRMIWEQQAKVILMLTHLVENGLEKCVDYLPESEVIDCNRLFGDFQIVLKKQEVKDIYIISTLQLKNMVSNSWREVTHFWYLGWPEKGVPAEGNSLIAFLIEARSYMKTASIDKRDGINGIQNGGANEHNPVIIHCSPGTGRTGVAIACDIAIREFETTRLVDIPKIVYRIRRDRAGAVQTKEQYMFIYKVVSLYATKLTGEALENF